MSSSLICRNRQGLSVSSRTAPAPTNLPIRRGRRPWLSASRDPSRHQTHRRPEPANTSVLSLSCCHRTSAASCVRAIRPSFRCRCHCRCRPQLARTTTQPSPYCQLRARSQLDPSSASCCVRVHHTCASSTAVHRALSACMLDSSALATRDRRHVHARNAPRPAAAPAQPEHLTPCSHPAPPGPRPASARLPHAP